MTDPGPGLPWFVIVGYVDGEIFVHYNSTARRFVPRTEWMAANMDQQYWDGQTEIAQGDEQVDRENLAIAARRYNQSGGSLTRQWIYGCDILEDGTFRGCYQVAYDGRDFIAFDKDTMTFTAAVPEAVPTKRAWEESDFVEGLKHYLEDLCPQWLRRYMEHGKAELGRTGEGGLWGCDVRQEVGIVPNSDGTYHTWVTIEAVPGDGDKYQCCVEHASLPQPGLYS
ncbi:class I histocompatibility antigen, F10 alpha chain-like [Excalfactoria chinensis]|uniref:class I histocompatibility antigen, F10 alpha chain-like n=1 Tax=Excalfactoria chinensis TaxID=46218 RepID=UPI003B3A21F2